jgi:hypothetical protein
MQERPERAAIILAFAGVLAWGAAGIAALPQGELYPALSFPSFGTSPLRDGVVTVTRPTVEVTFDGGAIETIAYRDLLPPESPNPINVFRNLMYERDVATDPATVDWLMSRLEEIHPDREVASVRVEWVRSTYRAADHDLVATDVIRSFVMDGNGS